MSAEVIEFRKREGSPPGEGNGALPLLRDFFDRVHPARVMARSILDPDEMQTIDPLPDADHLLAWLWEYGFKVVPVSET